MENIHIFRYFLAFLLFLGILLFLRKRIEGYYNYETTETSSPFNLKNSETSDLLLKDSQDFPTKKEIKLSDENFNHFMYEFPHTKNSNFGGSYLQETNNFRYQRSPDIGNSLPGELNSIFYQDNINRKSNIIKPLCPVKNDPDKVRVGFFNTSVDLLY